MSLDRLGLWPHRVLWLLAPLVVGPAFGPTLDDAADGPALIVEIALWAAWFAVLVAWLTPSPRSLTIVRAGGPATLGAILVAGLADGFERSIAIAAAATVLYLAFVFLPTVGDIMINGSAYGSERRMALRPPAFVLLGPVQVAWLGVFAGLLAAPALVLAERWVLAVIAAIVGAVAIWAGGRILHQLTQRWIVFVPAGFVVRDPMRLVDAILLRRNEVVSVGPALADDAGERTDLSGGALGLALQVSLREPTPITIRDRKDGKPMARTEEVTDIVFSPTLPGAMLTEARIRGMKVGATPVES